MKSKINVNGTRQTDFGNLYIFLKEFGTLVKLRYVKFIHSKINFVNHDKLVQVKRCNVI